MRFLDFGDDVGGMNVDYDCIIILQFEKKEGLRILPCNLQFYILMSIQENKAGMYTQSCCEREQHCKYENKVK